MIKIMFVCHGNICRSPMAEFIFKDIAKKAGLSDGFFVASSATSTEEIWNGIGNPVYPPAKAELARHGISCDGKRAVQLKKSDYSSFDYIICMDGYNVRNALRILGGDPDGKLFKLLSFTGEERDVSDPWFSDRFDIAYNDINNGCHALFDKLKKEAGL